MYKCHICGEIYEYPLCCPRCGERPVRDWMDDPEKEGERKEKFTPGVDWLKQEAQEAKDE